ncbi:MAG: InlB B-repeat-containing protein [Nitrososphaerales archaeon]
MSKIIRLLALKRTSIVIFIFVLILMENFGNYSGISPQTSQHFTPDFHISSAELSGDATTSTASVAYDEQIGITFTQSFASISYNVTAVAQQDVNGYGPAYLLNGLTNLGYWYQIGLSWDWPQLSGGYDAGFHMNYNVFDSTGVVVLPASGTGGSMNLSGTVNQGDSVGLSLSFSNGNVLMNVIDWNTSATAQVTYSSEGATQFIGLSAPSDSQGFFTGLMTEQYHSSPYTGNEQKVTYSDSTFGLSSGILWIDEYNVNNLQSQFQGNSGIISFSSNPTKLQSYSLSGATESANANNLITGSVNSVQLTLSYSVVGGGISYSAPVFSYVSDGFQQSSTLTTSPTVYSLDSGTSWSITSKLLGSTSIERWLTNQIVSGSAISATTINLAYYHQFLVMFAYSVLGGGSSYAAPTATAVQFGSKISIASGQKAWVDAGSPYSFTNPLAGSTKAERWEASNSSSSNGQISSSTTISPIYYHQYVATAGFIVTNGGLPPVEPTLISESFGATYSSSLVTTPRSYWMDVGSNYNISNVITSSQERWVSNSSTAGTITAPLSLDLKYDYQYYLTFQSSAQAGGTVDPSSEWISAGNSISISSNANPGWKFESWTGSGSGSYSGSTNPTTITVRAPITENATFYVGLTIDMTSDGTVSYSYGNSGTELSTQAVAYVPPDTTVTLNGNPSSFLYKLDSWSGAATGSSPQTTVTVVSPSTVEAHFGFDFVNASAIIAVIIVAIIGVAAAMMRRKSN